AGHQRGAARSGAAAGCRAAPQRAWSRRRPRPAGVEWAGPRSTPTTHPALDTPDLAQHPLIPQRPVGRGRGRPNEARLSATTNVCAILLTQRPTLRAYGAELQRQGLHIQSQRHGLARQSEFAIQAPLAEAHTAVRIQSPRAVYGEDPMDALGI